MLCARYDIYFRTILVCNSEPTIPAINPTSFPARKHSTLAHMVMGGGAGALASSICYPLDTIRRRMQMVGFSYHSQADAFATIWAQVWTNLLNSVTLVQESV